MANSQISIILLLNKHMSPFAHLYLFLANAICLVYTNFVTAVLALFFNVSVTFVSRVQIIAYHVNAVSTDKKSKGTAT